MIRCKFLVTGVVSAGYKAALPQPDGPPVETDQDAETITMQAVVCGSEENKSFSAWTPSGSLTLSVSNANVVGQLQPGDEVYLDITPAEGVATAG